jgi:hypothetical protein
MAHADAIKPLNTAAQPREAVDPAIYEGWDFDELNREARRIRRMEREKGRDAVVSSSRGGATTVTWSARGAAGYSSPTSRPSARTASRMFSALSSI